MPLLGLVYSSQGANGPIGLGWSLPLKEIRRVSRFGIPSYLDSGPDRDQYELGGELLVEDPATPERFHTFTESFRRIVFDPSASAWTVTLPNGTQLRLGSSDASRVRNPAKSNAVARWLLEEMEDPFGNVIRFGYDQSDPGTAYLTSATYTYRAGAPVGNLREVELVYESRLDPVQSFVGGLDTRITKRLRNVRSKVGGTLYRELELTYSDAGASVLTQVMESGCVGTASCETAPVQTLVYSKAEDEIGGTPTGPASAQWAPGTWTIPVAFEESAGAGEPRRDLGARMGDVDGDGLLDLVVAYQPATGGPTHKVYLNTGTGWVEDAGWSARLAEISTPAFEARITLVPEGPGTGHICDVTSSPYSSPVLFAEDRNFVEWVDPNDPTYRPPPTFRLTDLNGDGLADLYYSTDIGALWHSLDCNGDPVPPAQQHDDGFRSAMALLNTGDREQGWLISSTYTASLPALASFTATTGWGTCQFGSIICWTFWDHHGIPVELDGDGLADLVVLERITGSTYQEYTFEGRSLLNYGSGFLADATWDPPVAHYDQLTDPAAQEVIQRSAAVAFADLNGDGLTDLVRSEIEATCGAPALEAELGFPPPPATAWLNTGWGWCDDATCTHAARYLPDLPFARHFLVPSTQECDEISSNEVSLTDANGDGRVDLLQGDGAGPGRDVRLHVEATAGATVWTADARFVPPNAMRATELDGDLVVSRGVRVADVDGDGALDLVRSFETTQASELSGSSFPDLLASFDNGRGGVLDFAYSSAVVQRDAGLEALAATDAAALGEAGADGIARWAAVPVLQSITRSGLDVVTATTQLSYARPRWCAVHRSSLGFRLVRKTRPDTSLADTYFWQQHGRAGRTSREHVREDDLSIVYESTFDWELVADPGTIPGSISDVHLGRLTATTAQNRYGAAGGALMTSALSYNDIYGYNFVATTTTSRPTGSLTRTRSPRAADTVRWIVGLVWIDVVVDDFTLLAQISTYTDEGRVATVDLLDRRRDSTALVFRRWTFDHDEFGNQITVTDPKGRDSHVCYDGDNATRPGVCYLGLDDSHSLVRSRRDPAGRDRLYGRDLFTGAIQSELVFNGGPLGLDPGDLYVLTRDKFGRLLSRTVTPPGESALLLDRFVRHDGHDPATGARPHVEHFAQIGAGEEVRTATYPDGFGLPRLVVSETPAGYSGRVTHRDPVARQTKRTLELDCAADPDCDNLDAAAVAAAPGTTTTSDALGRPVIRETPDGVRALRHTAQQRASPFDPLSVADYDAVLLKNANGHLVEQILDAERIAFLDECNNAAPVAPAETDLTGVTCDSPDTTHVTYEASGEVNTIYDAVAVAAQDDTDPAHRIVLLYDTLGRQVEIQDPNGGTRLTEYDATGNVSRERNARLQWTDFVYDANLDLLEQVLYSGTEPDVTISYDPRTRRRESVSEAGGYLELFSYDSLGRLEREELTVSGTTLVAELEYDLLDRRTRIRYPDADTVVNYAYDGDYLIRVCEPAAGSEDCADPGATDYVSDIDYDALGRLETVHVAPGTLAYSYKPDTYRLSNLHLGGGSIDELDLSYDYDPLGNVEGVSDPSVFPSAAAGYTYDRRNRLESVTRGGVAKYFTYDALGNLTGHALDAPTDPPNQSYDPARPHAVIAAAGLTYQYDADGNATRRGGLIQTFDSQSRLTCVGTSGVPCAALSVLYDVDGGRIAQTELGIETLYLGELFEYQPSIGRAKAHILGAEGDRIAYKVIEGATLRSTSPWGVPWPRGGPFPWLPLAAILIGLGALALLAVELGGAGVIAHAGRSPALTGLTILLAALIGVPAPPAARADPPDIARRWVLNDLIGSAQMATDASGTRVTRRVFEPFGAVFEEVETPIPGEPDSALAETFAGHDRIAVGGLYYMNARWHDPTSGRFLSTDPVIRNVANPQSHNAYSYVENNPINLVDPTGACVAAYVIEVCFNFGGLPILQSPDFARPVSLGGHIPGLPDPGSCGGGVIFVFNPDACLPGPIFPGGLSTGPIFGTPPFNPGTIPGGLGGPFGTPPFSGDLGSIFGTPPFNPDTIPGGLGGPLGTPPFSGGLGSIFGAPTFPGTGGLGGPLGTPPFSGGLVTLGLLPTDDDIWFPIERRPSYGNSSRDPVFKRPQDVGVPCGLRGPNAGLCVPRDRQQRSEPPPPPEVAPYERPGDIGAPGGRRPSGG